MALPGPVLTKKHIVYELGTNDAVTAAVGTPTFRKSIPRTGLLSALEFIVYNPGKAATTFRAPSLKVTSGGNENMLECNGIQCQKHAKFITGSEVGTVTAAASAQMIDALDWEIPQTLGANVTYWHYPIFFGRYLGDPSYALNLPALKNDPVFEGQLEIAGAALDAAPQMHLAAYFLTGTPAPAQYIRTQHLFNEPTGVGKKDWELPTQNGLIYESLMLGNAIVTTADAGVDGLYAKAGTEALIEDRFAMQKISNAIEFGFPRAEIEAVATGFTYAMFKPREPFPSKAYDNPIFRNNRGATTTRSVLSARQIMPNPF